MLFLRRPNIELSRPAESKQPQPDCRDRVHLNQFPIQGVGFNDLLDALYRSSESWPQTVVSFMVILS